MRNAVRAVTRSLWASVILLLGVAAHAQETVPVSGTVLTEKGDPLPAVTVLATSRSNKSNPLTAVTNESGVFSFPRLRSGEVYDFTFTSVNYIT